MNEFAERLCGQSHYEKMEIQQRRRAVLQRRSKVKDLAAERRSKLEDCRQLMVFLQNCSEVSTCAVFDLLVRSQDNAFPQEFVALFSKFLHTFTWFSLVSIFTS